MANIQFEQVKQAYSGKPGCMCGCNGKYTTPEENPRSVKILINKLNKNPNTKFDADVNCFFVETKTRNTVIYLK